MQGVETLEAGMRRALDLARRSPADNANPQVGCVILAPDGRIVAEGWHRGAATPHAEADALSHLPSEWRDRAGELTAIVTLEPCNHTGRTGPCAVALASAGIGAVAYGAEDPSPVASGGAETLRAAGVEVIGGILATEANAILAPWAARQLPSVPTVGSRTHGQPSTARTQADGTYPREAEAEAEAETGAETETGAKTNHPRVTVKWAQTLDGRAAAADGSSQWITGEAARADVHRRRAQADAILVGTGTLIADNPSLTARTTSGELLVPAPEQPIPVVLGRREIPANTQIRQHPALAAHGLDAPLHFDGTDLAAHLAELHSRGVRSVFVEGGPTIASAFIAAGLADEVLIYLAPALLGGARLALGELGIESMTDIKRLTETTFEQLGDDLLVRASIQHNREGR